MRISDDRRSLGEVLGFVVIASLLLLLPWLGASNRIVFLGVIVVVTAIATYGLFVPFALAGQMTVAAITTWGVASFAVMLAANSWQWNLGRLIPVGVVAGAAAGFAFGLPVMRTSGHYFIVVTFAISQLGVLVGKNWDTVNPNSAGLSVSIRPTLFGWHLTNRNDVMHLAVAVLTLVFAGVLWLKRSRLGRRFAIVRENEQLAVTIGCPVNLYKLFALVMGGAICGLAAPLQVFAIRHIQVEEFALGQGITMVVLLVIGGRGYVLGPVFGAIFWYLLPELLGISALLGQAIFGLVLALAIIVAPEGLVALLIRAVTLGRRRSRPGTSPSSATSQLAEVPS